MQSRRIGTERQPERELSMKLAVFDFDGTLFSQDTIPFLFRQWLAQRRSVRRLIAACGSSGGMYISYKLGISRGLSREMVRRTALQRATRLFTGMSEDEVAEFFAHNAGLIVPLLRPSVVEELQKSQKAGFHTVLLSGGYEKLMEFVGAPLGIKTIIGTELHYKDGVVDARQALDIASGEDKAERLAAAFAGMEVDWDESTAYADSFSDLPVLKMVGHPVAVCPDKDLKAMLPEFGWRTLDK
mgnify:CR=1 FL=1